MKKNEQKAARDLIQLLSNEKLNRLTLDTIALVVFVGSGIFPRKLELKLMKILSVLSIFPGFHLRLYKVC